MNLASFPRIRYTSGPTPLEHLSRLSAELGGPEVWIKRDDQLGLTQGGNKTRKLEFLIADALAQGADTIVTVGGVQSNHCRLTLSAAVREGLHCQLVLEEDLGPDGHAIEAEDGGNPAHFNGNYLLFDLLGAEKVEVHEHGTDLIARMDQLAADLRSQGRRPYVIPVGGSNVTGALGYVDCADEIITQTTSLDVELSEIVVASGSAGMQAGLIAGLQAAGSPVEVLGINVSRSRQEQEPRVQGLADEVSTLLGIGTVPKSRVTALGDYVGPGYALPTSEMIAAVRLFAQTEGVVLDPVYTGKAAAGLVDLIRSGRYEKGQNVLFVHSGGAPGLYARAGVFAD